MKSGRQADSFPPGALPFGDLKFTHSCIRSWAASRDEPESWSLTVEIPTPRGELTGMTGEKYGAPFLVRTLREGSKVKATNLYSVEEQDYETRLASVGGENSYYQTSRDASTLRVF